MTRHHTVVALLSLACFICAPCTANAAELYGDESGEIHFYAFDGERNDVQVAVSGDRLVISDAGSSIVTPPLSLFDDGPRNLCAAGSANSASCPLARDSAGRPSGRVEISLLDGDDSATVGTSGAAVRIMVGGLEGNDRLTGSGAKLDGGPGDDTLRGSSLSGGDGNDVLGGTERADRLNGGPGDDVLSGAAGRDLLDGGAGADSLRGGADADALAPERFSPGPVSISTDGRANDGVANERDNVSRDIESFIGTDEADRFDIEDANKSSVLCANGNDVVVGDPIDDAFRDCERVTGARTGKPRPAAISVFPFTYVNRAGSRADARIYCHTDRTETCSGELTLRSLGGVLLGKADFRVPPRRGRDVVLDLTAAGRSVVARERRVEARASATTRIQRRTAPRAFAGDTVILDHGCPREGRCG